MPITKTKFINYIRCPRYVALDKIKKDFLDSKMSLEEYLKEEEDSKIQDLISSMYDEDGDDLIDVVDEQLKALLPYYKEVELLAGEYCQKHLPGTFKYSLETPNQESFDFLKNGIRYLCYVDIYNEHDDTFDIIEVKATTSSKVKDMGPTVKKVRHSIFEKDDRGIYCLRDEINQMDPAISEDKYLQNRAQLFNKYNGLGHYVYDLAVQRYFIEQDLKANHGDIANHKYYLAVLNSDYVYDGKKVDGKNVYEKDENGNEIISLIDLTKITEEYMDKIKLDVDRVESYINNIDSSECPLGSYCEYKKRTMCKFKPICFEKVPNYNSVFTYMGVKNIGGLTKLELINNNIVNALDVKEESLTNVTNIIQRTCIQNDTIYVDKNKIKAGLDSLEYPIYHLDFETFPCPLPRFRNEKCYTQSPFQFSLHIETKPGICDKDKDNYGYLAKDNVKDYRLEIGKALCDFIDIDHGGTVLAHNVPFERARLRELSELFDDISIKNKLKKMASPEHSFDTLYLVRNNRELYKDLGILEKIDVINYYSPKLNGSYSIKKVLPIFSNLSYADLDVKNGTEALVTYSNFDKMTKEEYDFNYHALINYCKQDTWAMVEILNGLRTLVK